VGPLVDVLSSVGIDRAARMRLHSVGYPHIGRLTRNAPAMWSASHIPRAATGPIPISPVIIPAR